VYPEVRVQIRLAHKQLLAHGTRVLPVIIARMYLLVALTQALRNEPSATYLTAVRFHAHVPILVIQERLFGFETSRASFAGVGFVGAVYTLVDDQIGFVLEALTARITLVLIPPRVLRLMLVQTWGK
jgi:hypothetical protein